MRKTKTNKEVEMDNLFDFDDVAMPEEVMMTDEEKLLTGDAEPEEEKPMTAIDALENIMVMMEDSRLDQSEWELLTRECEMLNKMYGLTPFQCYMVAMMMENDGEVNFKQMSRHLNCSQLRMYRLKHEADELVERRLAHIDYCSNHNNRDYCLEQPLSNAIEHNVPYEAKALSEMNAKEVLEVVRRYLVACQHTELEEVQEGIVKNIRKALDESAHLQMSAAISNLKLNDDDLLMLCVAGVHIVLNDEGNIGPMDWADIWYDDENNSEVEALQNGTSVLAKEGYLVPQERNGQCINGFFKLTNKAMGELFPEFKKMRFDTEGVVHTEHQLVKPEDISPKQLFYNPAEAEQVQRLGDLLSKDKFRGVQQRLKESGLRQGFACLFYGDPGTGKTETVLQLARQTGRLIMRVDMSKLRDKYVGESEKAVQSLFDEYSALLRAKKEAPILLLNEADAILTRRNEGSVNSVDKMENAMQNIILQALETFEGIVIATTNLTGSLDAAFERRFLYKIKFGKPCQEVKEKIWHAMLPDLAADETRELAKCYDFSGGQIENIKRKQVVDYLLYGKRVGYDHIVELCKEEKLAKNKPMGAIGFRV